MEWLIYLSKVSVCMGLFYAFYYLSLQRLTFFNLNRFYLLTTLILSFVIPMLQLQVQSLTEDSSKTTQASAIYTSTFTDRTNTGATVLSSFQQTDESLLAIDWPQVLFVSYLLIAILMLSIFAFQAIQILKHTRQVHQKIGRLKVVFKVEGFTNCSFLNYVFLNRQELSDEEVAVILHHENVHISRYHSIDKLLITICKALLWFNPLAYLYERALEQVHEYEADKETSATIGNTPYANILLTMAVRKRNPSLTHSFVRNALKGRIKMLFNNQSKNMKKLIYLLLLPLGLVLTWTFAVQVVYANPSDSTLKEIEVKPTQIEKTPLKAVSYRELKTTKILTQKPQSDTLWMIDYPLLSKYTEVIIDGKSYDADILTKISPRCISTTRRNNDKIEITTHNNKIEYATQIDRENVIIRKKALALGKVYTRYPQKHQDGSRYEEISIKQKSGVGGSVGLDKGKKLLLLYNGKQYSEREFKALAADQFKDCNMSFRSGLDKGTKAKYGKEYGSMIAVSKIEIPLEGIKKAFRNLDNNDEANSKISYTARDSVVVGKEKQVSLFGEVRLTQAQLNITADKVKYENANQIIYAKNVSFTSELYQNPIIEKFVKFDLKEGTYQILSSISGL
ncbi:hypothetical protein CPT03_20175 [Pedobacter ginsengisoli]|uniref:Peptidase M56 domain-containing protein n=1 Tax=Pedobacter ginsengisoli TaxID=363852 RepID=A0A2D1UAI8_9SPHI|nr:M56 family metallopeptidase [Pedobacter ginsengisoli]ATP58615.1 hypothetical protein CPT03_20175 [Pedobacter ginsengisoli]